MRKSESDDVISSSVGSLTPTSQRQVVKNQPNLGALKNLAASKAPLTTKHSQ